jgi:valyl-tRNA synthetase
MDKEYNPLLFEERVYRTWEESGSFSAPADSKKPPFTIAIPPPNRTGVLHMGHALNNSLQDVLIRWKRMSGFNACWIPGTDHAGIATQSVVERLLEREGQKKEDLGRERFVGRVRAFADDHGDMILNQLRLLGCSCDWAKTRYTLDPGLSAAVRKVFVHLYRKELIYRATAIVNTCPVHHSLSDEEVDHFEEQGHLWYIRYPVQDPGANDPAFLTVATTRPETMLGDVAVAVHPADERFAELLGRTVVLPLMEREIPIIADDFVDPRFGTGCVKVTPSHDPNDFAIGRRHGLPGIKIMDERGVMNEKAGVYAGLDRFDCRKKAVQDLEAQGLLERIEEHTHQVGHCQRCGRIVEPYESTQWFVKMAPLARPALELVEKGELTFHAPRWTKVYLNWLENIHDWCISRQLWWGHRIPVWYCDACGAVEAYEEDPAACRACGSEHLRQEEDVLDTWFSSWLWPFSTLGWPEKTPELKTFYPTDVLITGPDIIFFWVARMVMAGLEFTEKKPFSDVVLTSIVRDEENRKMSKSLGNSVDPLDVIAGRFGKIYPDKFQGEEKPYGADALRMSLFLIPVQGPTISLSYERFETGGNFINKLWNAGRLLLSHLDDAKIGEIPYKKLSPYHAWILHRLNAVGQEVTGHLEGFRFYDAATALYNFVWFEFCDWFLEMVKPSLQGWEGKEARRLTQTVAAVALDTTLRLLHPFIPFVTEEIWGKLPQTEGLLIRAAWPKPRSEWERPEDVAVMECLQAVVRVARNLRQEVNLKPSLKVPLVVACPDDKRRCCLEKLSSYIERLAHLSEVRIHESAEKPKFCATGLHGHIEIFMPLDGLVDVTAEVTRLNAEIAKVEKEITHFEKKLGNEKYIQKAPAAVVAKDSEKLADYRRKLDKLAEARERLLRMQGERA